MLLWFVLTAAALLFVAVDIRTTPESPVLKWGFVLLTAYTGVVGAFLYVLGCREPLPGLHERYVAARWRQTLGSTMHCVAGDGVGIIAGAALSSVFGLAGLAEIILEYVLGFAFGWTIFQALFMRDMAGGSSLRALSSNVHLGTALHEPVDGRNGADGDGAEIAYPIRGRSDDAVFLVRDVDGPARRLHLRLSDELVVGGLPSQAWDDDGAPGGGRRARRAWYARRSGRPPCRAGHGHGQRRCSLAAGAGHGVAFVRGIGGRRGDRFPVAGCMSGETQPASRQRAQTIPSLLRQPTPALPEEA
jgi:hypothetical protein